MVLVSAQRQAAVSPLSFGPCQDEARASILARRAGEIEVVDILGQDNLGPAISVQIFRDHTLTRSPLRNFGEDRGLKSVSSIEEDGRG